MNNNRDSNNKQISDKVKWRKVKDGEREREKSEKITRREQEEKNTTNIMEKQEIISGRQNSFREIVSISIEKRWTLDAILCHTKKMKSILY